MVLLTAERAATIRPRLNTTATLQLFDSIGNLPLAMHTIGAWTKPL